MSKEIKLIFLLDFLKDLNLITIILAPFVIFLKIDFNLFFYIVASFRITQVVTTIPIGLFLDRIQPKYAILISGLLYLFGLFFLIQDGRYAKKNKF